MSDENTIIKNENIDSINNQNIENNDSNEFMKQLEEKKNEIIKLAKSTKNLIKKNHSTDKDKQNNISKKEKKNIKLCKFLYNFKILIPVIAILLTIYFNSNYEDVKKNINEDSYKYINNYSKDSLTKKCDIVDVRCFKKDREDIKDTQECKNISKFIDFLKKNFSNNQQHNLGDFLISKNYGENSCILIYKNKLKEDTLFINPTYLEQPKLNKKNINLINSMKNIDYCRERLETYIFKKFYNEINIEFYNISEGKYQNIILNNDIIEMEIFLENLAVLNGINICTSFDSYFN